MVEVGEDKISLLIYTICYAFINTGAYIVQISMLHLLPINGNDKYILQPPVWKRK